MEESLSASLGVGNPSGIVCQRFMDIKQQTNKQKNNWWIDIDGFTYETWETRLEGISANGASNNLKVTDLTRFFAFLPDFQTINTLQ